ncbi:bifunctional 3,4-dihydroxy-2-butanone-4-phosphate synthase/GTP cyclohydrolase II [candidate division KSB1 bacterium]
MDSRKNRRNYGVSTVEEAITEYRNGNILIVVDDADRENEGDFICSAESITHEKINFMSKYGRGLICLALTGERAEELELDLMVHKNTAVHQTAFTVSIDAVNKTTTGISAYDRARTILTAIDPATKPNDLARPGHVFPLKASKGGILIRAGHTEAAVDMSRLAGHTQAGVLCEIMDDDGSMARMPKLKEIAEEHGLKIITIADLIQYRRHNEHLIEHEINIDFPSAYGNFKIHMFRSVIDNRHHLALVKGEIDTGEPVLVRVHSECLTGDILGSLRCDCGPQLQQALRQIEKEGRGVLLYMRQEGRGIGLPSKIFAYALQEQGRDTVQANEELGFKPDLRDYGEGAQILYKLGIRKIRLLTNNPKKVVGLKGYGLEIVERVPIEIEPNAFNNRYLEAKRDKMGHFILSS